MKIIEIKCLTIVLALCSLSVFAQKKNSKDHFVMKKMIHDNFIFAEKQYQYLEKATPPNEMPRSFKDNRNVSSDVYWWTSGFYPGSLLYIYEYTKNPLILAEAKKRLTILDTVKYCTATHDLGFMMFCSFGNAYRLTKNEEYKKVVLESAKSLATRYRPKAKVIQSWDTGKGNKEKESIGPVIIDNMMNLEMLEWTSQNSTDKSFARISENHADVTMKNHFRPDYSSYHVLEYDFESGEVTKKHTNQGYSDSSAWRGTKLGTVRLRYDVSFYKKSCLFKTGQRNC